MKNQKSYLSDNQCLHFQKYCIFEVIRQAAVGGNTDGREKSAYGYFIDTLWIF